MKVVNGWISNSSSSSFIIKVDGELNREKAEKLLRKSFEYINEEVLQENIDKLISASTPIEEADIDFMELSKYDQEAIKKAEEEGNKIYQVWLSDHTGDMGGILNATESQWEEGDVDSEDYLELCWYYNMFEFILSCRSCH